ncbi:hypothetical protein BH20VER2_BH20VER2_17170 [soil metagenome]|nr:hypothetical protein [Chthoniobacterales bacterium]
MASESLPPAVAALISRYIRSVEQLEVLLLLHGQPERFWTADEVYDVIRSSRSSVMQRLENFTAEEFLETEPGPPRRFRYAPKAGELRSAVDETATVYQTWRIRVIEAIFAPADPVQSFADAFKFRKT